MSQSSSKALSVAEIVISSLGSRGEGVAEFRGRRVYIPFATPGERVLAEIHGERGRVLKVLESASGRLAPFCPHFGTCGGCSVQTLSVNAYAEWKRGLVADALRRAGVKATVDPLVEAHGEGRRRAVFHVRQSGGGPLVGFMRARTHELQVIDACPLFSPAMTAAPAAARAIAAALAPFGRAFDIVVAASETGLDLDLRGQGPLPEAARRAIIAAAEAQDLARLSNHGELVIERRRPRLIIGRAEVTPPSGAFMQATEAGERALWELVADGLAGARHVADLFAGFGAFALRMAEFARAYAADSDLGSIAALSRAVAEAPGLRPVAAERRDLFKRPLAGRELEPFDAVVFDPPRAGALAQAEALARSPVATVIAVSCAPAALARDAAVLAAGGYCLERVTPVDQFRGAAHVETVAVFRKASRRHGRLLG